MKKVLTIGLIICILSQLCINGYAEETQTQEDFILEAYYFTVKDYRAFCDDPYNIEPLLEGNKVFMNYAHPTPVIYCPYFREEFARAHANNETIDACVKSVHPDIEIYKSYIIKFPIHFCGRYGLGDIVWLSTNKGLKLLEYKDFTDYNIYEKFLYEDLKPEGRDMHGYDVIYYDSFDEYLERYRSITAEICVNGEKVENAISHVVGGKRYVLPLRFLLESCGVEVTYKEDFGGQVIFQGNDKSIYILINNEKISHFSPEVLINDEVINLSFFQEPQYTSYLNKLKGVGEYEYIYLYPLSKSIGMNVSFIDWNDRIMVTVEEGNCFLELFGKKIEKHTLSDGVVYLEIIDIPEEDLYPVPQSPEEEEM